jgi:long-chain acyl-CoA synthetase
MEAVDMALNLYEVFQQTARTWPEQPALLGLGQGEVLSYRALDEAILLASAGLARAGVGPGTCVGLHVRSGPSYIVATYAAWHRGACVVPIPVELAGPEKETVFRTVALDYVIAPADTIPFLTAHLCGSPVVFWPGTEVQRVTPLRTPPAELASVNAAFVRFTSGTTATAKGVVLSHETIYERIRAANEVLRLGPKDRIVWLLSMAYHFAVSIVSYLSSGAGIILPPNHFADTIVDAARRHGGTVIYGSPAHYSWLAAASTAGPWSQLRLPISTTAPLDRATAEAFRARFHVPVVQALGIIEVGLPFVNLSHAEQYPEAVGQVLPAYQLRLEDIGLQSGARAVLLRGPGLVDAYYDPWRPRSAILSEGWFRTGDVAEMNANGCLILRGRIEEVINVLGMKFFPQEVEAVLCTHPVVESARVFARPELKLGEVPQAQVVLRPGLVRPSEAELVAHCGKALASFKVPESIEVVRALPRTASGKIIHRLTASPEDR